MRGRFILAALLVAGGLRPGWAAPQTADKAATYSSHPQAGKISVNLLRLDWERRGGASARAAARVQALGAAGESEIALTLVLDETGPDLRTRLEAAGLRVLSFSARYRRATVAVSDLSLLYRLAEMPEVRSIGRAHGAVTFSGAVGNRAGRAMGADLARRAFLASGRGVTIGILSDSFARKGGVRDADTRPPPGRAGLLTGSRPQDSGDLPPGVLLRRDDLEDSARFIATDEGAAMAELIHDLAPAANLAFHTAFPDQATFAEGVEDLMVSAGATVLVDDILFLDEPMYQPGIPAQAVAEAVSRGVLYFSAAGNLQNLGVQMEYVDLVPATDDTMFPVPSGNDFHEWAEGDAYLDITVPEGKRIRVVLQWNQPFDSLNPGKGSEVDLDMYLLSVANAVALTAPLARSADQQGSAGSPRGDAVEVLDFINIGLTPISAFLAIDHFTGSQGEIAPGVPLELRLVIFASDPVGTIVQGIPSAESQFGNPTIYGHAAVPGVLAIGAVGWFETPAFDPSIGATLATDPESFSSLGGTLIQQFDAAGDFALAQVFKPDLAAPDGNNTTFFGRDLLPGAPFGEPDGFPNFFGTSASVANAAAVGAMIQSLDPALTAADIRQVLTETAFDVLGFRAAPGVDSVTGAGLIDAVTALNVVAAAAVEAGKERPNAQRLIAPGRTVHEYLGFPDPTLGDSTHFEAYSLEWPGGDLEIALASEDADAFLIVFEAPGEPTGTRLQINASAARAETYRREDAPPGIYTIWANTFEPQAGGYRLFVSCDEPLSNTVGDAGMEAPAGGAEQGWTGESTNFGTPICNTADCDGGGVADPRTGDGWAWFGRVRVDGSTVVRERGAIEQSVRISRGAAATLEFHLWNGASSGNGLDTFRVLVDGIEMFTLGEGHPAYAEGYEAVRLDLTAFADGATHDIRFEADMRAGASATSFSLDDVTLTVCGAPTAAGSWTIYR